jgi:hypothetical protein
MENAIWGLIGVFVGAIVMGLISFINTRQQLTHGRERDRLDRFIRAKEAYLIPLRETIAEWVLYSRLEMVRWVVLKEEGLAKNDPGLYRKLYDDSMSVSKKQEELSRKLDILLSQVSDMNLYKQIESLKEQTEQANLSIIPVVTLFRDIKDKIQPDQIAKAKEQSRILSDKIHNLLIPINQRIEILLSEE